MRKYKLFIFDFDGTLVDTLPDISYHANAVLERMGCPKRRLSQVERAIGWGVHELFMGLAPQLAHDKERLDEAVVLFKKRYSEDPVARTKPYPYVRRMLSGPLKDISKVILTNKPQEITERILKALELEKYFLKTIGMQPLYPPKPDPTTAKLLLRQFEVLPEQALLIGDSAVDHETAQNAGIAFVWMRYGYDDSLRRVKPIRSMRSAAQWAKLLTDERPTQKRSPDR